MQLCKLFSEYVTVDVNGVKVEYRGVQSCQVKHDNSGEVTARFMLCQE
jgi:hypothetical protein